MLDNLVVVLLPFTTLKKVDMTFLPKVCKILQVYTVLRPVSHCHPLIALSYRVH
jgi:hypothetical protein